VSATLAAALAAACANESSDVTSSAIAVPDAGDSTSATTPPETTGPFGGVTVVVDRGCTESPCTSDRLRVTVTSLRDDDVTITAGVQAFGLDQRSAERTLGEARTGATPLKARGAVSFDLLATDLPVQSVGAVSSASVGVAVVDASGVRTVTATSPFLYAFDAAYQHATFYEVATAAALGDKTADAQLTSPVGRVYDAASGAMIDVRELRPTGGTGYTVLGGSYTAQRRGTGKSPPPPPDLTYQTKVCYTLKAQYADAGFGEDVDNLPASKFGNFPATQHIPAAYVAAWIRKTGDIWPMWEGFLDKNGCTPVLALGGSYVFTGFSQLARTLANGDATFDVEVMSNGSDTYTGWNTAFVASGAPVIPLEPSWWDPTLDVIGTITHVISRDDTWVTAQAYHTFVEHGCPNPTPGVPPTDSCGNANGGGTTFIGPGKAWGAGFVGTGDDAISKYIVAHEHGHTVQGIRFMPKFSAADYTNGDDPQGYYGLCRCDHHRAVQVVGQADVDRVDVLAIDHRPPVSGGLLPAPAIPIADSDAVSLPQMTFRTTRYGRS